MKMESWVMWVSVCEKIGTRRVAKMKIVDFIVGIDRGLEIRGCFGKTRKAREMQKCRKREMGRI